MLVWNIVMWSLFDLALGAIFESWRLDASSNLIKQDEAIVNLLFNAVPNNVSLSWENYIFACLPTGQFSTYIYTDDIHNHFGIY